MKTAHPFHGNQHKKPFINDKAKKDILLLVLAGYAGVSMIMYTTQFIQSHNFRNPLPVHFEFSVKPQVPWTPKVISPLASKSASFNFPEKVYAEKKPTYMESEAYLNSTQEWKEFVAAAYKLAPIYDYPVNVLLSQAALESAHGTSYFALTRNNFFGMNCNDGKENQDCTYYSTPEESIVDYMHLVKRGGRYFEAYQVRSNPEEMISLIKRAGYASDPHYVAKVIKMPEWSL